MSDVKDVTIQSNPLSDFTQREIVVLSESKENGIRPVAMTLVNKLFAFFLEGYSCLEISKFDKGLSEGDILALRERFEWDEKKRTYLSDLHNQVQGKLIKNKMESVEFLTNAMTVIHKEHKDSMIKYMMSGNPEDMPKIPSMRLYKDIIDSLQKVTGEDRVHKVQGKLESSSTFNVNVSGGGAKEIDLLAQILQPENAAKVLSHLAKDQK